MKYTLMHKNIPVLNIEINDIGRIEKIIDIICIEHLPVGVQLTPFLKDTRSFNSWWCDRCIPPNRSGLDAVLETLSIKSPEMLLTRCYGLSLSDHYWIKPHGTELLWNDINFFNNSFSEDIGNLLFGEAVQTENIDLCSPDNTSDGCLKKRWKIINGKRCLIKAGELPFYQQPFNEVIASRIMDRLDIPHVSYSIMWQNEEPYSVCEDFITTETELVSAYRVTLTRPKANHENTYLHFVNLCHDFGVKDIEKALDKMIVLDYIIANEDRHMNNFGIIRNADTLEWLGFAPVFDSGTSLGYNKPAHQLAKSPECKPFKKTHGEQLKLVTSFDWLDLSKLSGIENDISDIMATEQAKSVLGDTRCADITHFIMDRIDKLKEIVAASDNNLSN